MHEEPVRTPDMQAREGGSDMGRWQVLAVGAALALATVAVAQDATEAPGTAMQAVSSDAAELYEDVQILRTIRTLELSSEQMVELLAVNAQVLEEQADLAELRDEMWAEYQDEIQQVLDAWMKGETPSTRARTRADRAVNRVNEARGNLQNARWDATEELYDLLTDAQRDLVEPPGVAEEREARIERMGGVQSVGAYVADRLDAIRDLMPEEFDMLAPSEARRIARAIVGPDAGDLEQMTGAVLDMMREIYAWEAERYRQQRESLPVQITSALGFPTEDQRAPVSWSELMRAATSGRTPAVIAAITPAGGGEVE